MPNYKMELSNGENSIPLPDPFKLLLKDYVQCLDNKLTPNPPKEIEERMIFLDQIIEAYS